MKLFCLPFQLTCTNLDENAVSLLLAEHTARVPINCSRFFCALNVTLNNSYSANGLSPCDILSNVVI